MHGSVTNTYTAYGILQYDSATFASMYLHIPDSPLHAPLRSLLWFTTVPVARFAKWKPAESALFS